MGTDSVGFSVRTRGALARGAFVAALAVYHGCFLVSPVWAQTGPAPTSDTSALEEVTVTARRTKENLQEVPVAVTVFNANAIAEQQIVSPEDLDSKVPSLSVTTSGSARDLLKYTIRGQGEGDEGGEPAVVTYFAEVPALLTGPGSLYDLQSLQVLKGPQGTLFGRNTTGGAILVEPQRPSNEFGGYIDLTAGDYSLGRFQGALNLPLIDNVLAVRLAADVNDRDGYTRDVFTGTRYDNVHYHAGRLGVSFTPVDWFEDYFVADYYYSSTHGAGTALLSVNPTGLAATLFPQSVALFDKYYGTYNVAEYTGGDPYDIVQSGGVSNAATFHVTNDIYIKDILGFRQYKQRYTQDVIGAGVPIVSFIPTPYDTTGSSGPQSQNDITNELQVGGDSFDKRLKWLTGLYAEWDNPTSDLNQDDLAEFGQQTFVLQSLDRDTSKAIFGQFTYDLSDFIPKLKFTGGARYTWDTREQTASEYLNTPAVCNLAGVVPNCVLRVSAAFRAPTGNLDFDYQLTPNTLLYVASRHGYKSGGFNATSPDLSSRVFQPEFVTDVELGEKSDFNFSGIEGRVNVALYRQWYSSIQEPTPIFSGDQEVTVTTNAGTAIIQGVELEYTVIPNKYFEVSGFYDYIDAYYTHNLVNGVNLDGIAIAQTPRSKVSVTGRFNLAQLPDEIGQIYLSANYVYQSRIEFQVPLLPADPDPNHGQAGYSLVNLHAGWSNVFRKPVDVSFFMTNVTNKYYAQSGTGVYPSAGINGGLLGEPRMFGFDFKYRFGGG
jgi:iron complex outermembrane recepter protein